MTHLLLIALLAADPLPADAPTRPAMTLKAGESIPFDGVCMDDVLAVRTGKRLASAEAQVSQLDGKTMVSTPLLVGGVVAVVALVAGFAAAGYVAGQKSR